MGVPLAERLRPKSLDEFVGQEHLVGNPSTGSGPAGPLRISVEGKHRFSFILWGPPGSGKTTLARIYTRALGLHLTEISAVSAGKDEMRQAVKAGGVLFVDEIHRFNKAQQDYLLPYVENGTIILIGATTENPSFEVISPLLSRCRVFVLKELREEELESISVKAEKELNIKINKDVFGYIAGLANGDARQFINLIEVTTQLYGEVTEENINKALQSKHLRYDKLGEEHYNTISAFIKSMRASDADAALYYLARMVESGEDPLFIARRMVIFALEDIGMAQPTALVVANEVFRACETIGYPECAINLAHGVVYLAKAKKDRSACDAYFRAVEDVKKFGNLPIPLKIRNAPTKLMKELGYGRGYQAYTKESLLPDELKNKKYIVDKC